MTAIATSQVRQRAIQAYRSGQGTQNQIASLFGISYHGFRKWLKDFEFEGRTVPRPRGHNPSKFQGDLLKELDELIQNQPDIH